MRNCINASRGLQALLPFTLAVWLPAAGLAETANSLYQARIWVPAGWDEPEVAGDAQTGRDSFRPSTPTDLRSLGVGATVGLESVSIHESRTSNGRPTYQLQLEDGTSIYVTRGATVRIGKVRYRVLGERGGVLQLQDIRTRRIQRYRQKPASAR